MMAARVPLEELVKKAPEEIRVQVYDFASYLLEKHLRKEDRDWDEFSVREAMRGLEGEPLYTKADIEDPCR